MTLQKRDAKNAETGDSWLTAGDKPSQITPLS